INVEPLSAETMAGLLIGEDAVVWSAGAGGGNPARTKAVDEQAAIRSMEAAKIAGVSRYVMVSWFYDRAKGHGVPADLPFHHHAQAKAAADAYLQNTDLDGPILGPSALTENEGTGQIEVGGNAGEVTRDDVAHVAAEVLARPETAGKVINFNNGSTPIAPAL